MIIDSNEHDAETSARQKITRWIAIVAGATVGSAGALGGADILSPRALSTALAALHSESAPKLDRVLASSGQKPALAPAREVERAPAATPALASDSLRRAPLVMPAPAQHGAPAAVPVPPPAAPPVQPAQPAAPRKTQMAAAHIDAGMLAPSFTLSRPLVAEVIPVPDLTAAPDQSIVRLEPAQELALVIPEVFPGREHELPKDAAGAQPVAPQAAGLLVPTRVGEIVEVPMPPARPEPTPAERLGLDGKERAKAEKCLAQAIYFEARNEPVRGQIAVAQVVLNRVFSPYYPKDVCSVVYQNAHRHLSCQFTFACDGIPEAVRERGAWARAARIAKQTLDAKLWLPEVAKSTHYHAVYVRPYWVREMRKMVRHGRHTFYRPHRWGDGANEPGWGRGEAPKGRT